MQPKIISPKLRAPIKTNALFAKDSYRNFNAYFLCNSHFFNTYFIQLNSEIRKGRNPGMKDHSEDEHGT